MDRHKKTVTLWDLLVWAYRDQKVHVSRSDNIQMGHGECNARRVGRHMALGTFIDGGGAFGASLAVDPDADLVHDVMLKFCLKEFLIKYAESGSVPDLDMVYIPPAVKPVWRRPGKMSVVYDDNRHIIACDIKIIGTTQEQFSCSSQRKKEEYERFIEYLEALEERLSTVALHKRRLQGLGVVRKPWESSVEAVRPKTKVLV